MVEDQPPQAYCYADETQIYLSFKPISSTSQEDAVRVMECCIEKIRRWLIPDRLLLNDDRTEVLKCPGNEVELTHPGARIHHE